MTQQMTTQQYADYRKVSFQRIWKLLSDIDVLERNQTIGNIKRISRRRKSLKGVVGIEKKGKTKILTVEL